MTASSEAEQKFDRVKAQLKARLGTEVYSSWFGRMKVAEASKGIVRISVPTAFLRSWINGHYLDLISELWKHEDPELLKIEIVVRTATRQGRGSPEPEMPTARKMTKQTQTALATGTAGPGRVERAPAPRPQATLPAGRAPRPVPPPSARQHAPPSAPPKPAPARTPAPASRSARHGPRHRDRHPPSPGSRTPAIVSRRSPAGSRAGRETGSTRRGAGFRRCRAGRSSRPMWRVRSASTSQD